MLFNPYLGNTFNFKIGNPNFLSQLYFSNKDILFHCAEGTCSSIDTNKINRIDSALIKVLNRVLYNDQHYREILVKLQTSNAPNVDSIVLISDTIGKYDSLNLRIVEDIISKLK